MKFNPEVHHRRSIRMPAYDYSQAGAYFIAVVADNRACIFGAIENGEMHSNMAGEIVWEIWRLLPTRYTEIALGEAVLMPNHFHGIIEIPVGAMEHRPPMRPVWAMRACGPLAR